MAAAWTNTVDLTVTKAERKTWVSEAARQLTSSHEGLALAAR